VKYKNLNDISTDSKLWFKYALKITSDKNKANDILSEMYMIYASFFDRYPNKVLSKAYIYKTLQNCYFKNRDIDSKTTTYSEYKISPDEAYEDIPFDEVGKSELMENNNDKIVYSIHQGIMDLLNNNDDVDWFHNTIFRYVMIDGMSIRSLAKQSGIHFNILQSSIKNTKEKLQKIYSEEYGRIKKN